MNYTLGRPFSALQACFVTRCHSGCRGGKRRQVVSVWYAINHFFRDRPILTYIQRYIHRVSTLQAGWYFGFAKKKYLLHTKHWQIFGAIANKWCRCERISNHSRLHMVHIGLYQPKLPHEMGGSVHNRFHHHHFPPYIYYIEIRFSCAYWLLSVICLLDSHLSKCCVSHR